MLVVLVGLMMAGFSALCIAQEGGAKAEGEKAAKAKGTTKIEKALAQLTLSDEEKGKVDPVLAEYKEKAKTAEIKDQKALIAEYAPKIADLLTADNKAKFEEAMKAKRSGKKEGGPKKEAGEKKEGGAEQK
jgi:hypothetical protein